MVTVGAVEPENGQPIAGSGRPVDVVGVRHRRASRERGGAQRHGALQRHQRGDADWPFPVRTCGWTLPAPPVAYSAMVGYGLVNAASDTASARGVLGALTMPDRAEADTLATSVSLVRQRLWGFSEQGAKPQRPRASG